MALVKCPDCGRGVSDAAPTCPNCGRPIAAARQPAQPPLQFAPPPEKKRSSFAGMGCVVILILLVIGAITSGGSGSSGSSAPRTIDLKATVQFTGTQVNITNLDTFAWTGCKVEINDDFEHQLGTVPKGTTMKVGAMLFTDDDGKRFNPFQYAPKRVMIVCDTPGGRGYYVGSWN